MITAIDAAFDVAAAETGDGCKTNTRLCAVPTSPRHRHWTPEEEDFLRDNIGRFTDTEIARRLRRTPTAVHIHMERELHLAPPSKLSNVMTAECVAIGLGCDSKSVHKLIDRGLMRGSRTPSEKSKGIRLVDTRVLAEWMIDPGNWIYFRCNSVATRRKSSRPIPKNYDFLFFERMRSKVVTARRRWTDAWLTPGQVAALLRTAGGTRRVNAAIHRGTLPAKRWGNWWILRSSLPQGTTSGMTLNCFGEWMKRRTVNARDN